MDLEYIMLNEISWIEKVKYCMTSLIYGIKKTNNEPIETEQIGACWRGCSG